MLPESTSEFAGNDGADFLLFLSAVFQKLWIVEGVLRSHDVLDGVPRQEEEMYARLWIEVVDHDELFVVVD